eukprot:12241398-Alexandrium_andersonii.AAC.1
MAPEPLRPRPLLGLGLHGRFAPLGRPAPASMQTVLGCRQRPPVRVWLASQTAWGGAPGLGG